MKLKAVLLPALAGLLCVVAAPGAAQCPSTGCPAQTLGTVEVPVEGALVSGYVRVSGFALDGNLVSNVDLFIDGTADQNQVTAPGGANINLPRADVIQAFPAYAGTAGSDPGWEMSFRAANYSNGFHTLLVRITDVTGCCYFLAPRTVRIDNGRNQAPFGAVNLPKVDDSVQANGVLEVTGWALDDRVVDHVDILVDDLLERQAVTGIYRPDVAAKYPDTPNALISGFILNLDSTRMTNGVHTIAVKAVDDQGQQGLLGTRRVQVFNNSPNLPPFGEVEYPLLNSTWFGNCTVFHGGGPSGGTDIQDARFVMWVTGWALDTSVVQERGGVSHVFVEIDGVTLKDSQISCHREFTLNNRLVDCYGYYRPDIEILYPGFQQAPNCGFSFAIDVGVLLTQRDFREGGHILQVKAADKEDQITLLKEISVTFECSSASLDPPPIAYVDDPPNYKMINGIFPVIGWALDLDGVAEVHVLIDGVKQVDAVTGIFAAEYGLASPDVGLVYQNYPNSSYARWRFYLDTTQLSNSEHDLLVEVLDGRGNLRSAGTRRFLVDNNTLVR
jgi:Bacterial Ig domain